MGLSLCLELKNEIGQKEMRIGPDQNLAKKKMQSSDELVL
jgi:hypothetical protein